MRSINGEYTPGEAKKEKKTTNAIIMGGAFQMDRVLQSTSGAASELAFQAEQKIKATANYFHNLVINGTSDAVGKGCSFHFLNRLRYFLFVLFVKFGS